MYRIRATTNRRNLKIFLKEEELAVAAAVHAGKSIAMSLSPPTVRCVFNVVSWKHETYELVLPLETTVAHVKRMVETHFGPLRSCMLWRGSSSSAKDPTKALSDGSKTLQQVRFVVRRSRARECRIACFAAAFHFFGLSLLFSLTHRSLLSSLSHPSRTCLNILPQVGFGTKKAQLRGYVDVAVDFVPINPSILARVSPLPVVSIASLHAPSARVAGAMPTRSERGEFFR